MKAVFLGTRGFPNIQGGVEKHCEFLAVNLVKLGCDCTVFTRTPYADADIKEFNGVKLINLPAIKSKFLEAFLHTFIGIFAARPLKPDVLHIQAIGPSFFTLLARIFGMKVVVTSHGPNYKHLKWKGLSRPLLKFFEYIGVTFSNEYIAISETIADEIKEKYKKNVIVIPNGVSIPYIRSTETALKQHGIEKGMYILSVGRFVPEKGFGDLIQGFNNLKIQNHGWKLVIAGDADHEDSYSRGLKQLSANSKDVILTGRLTGLPLEELYSHAGLFVLPSYYEGLPIVLLEAMSYGLSCIVSDIPANREVGLGQDRCFEPGNIQEMGKRIRGFMSKPLSENEKASQIKSITEKYNWETIAAKTLAVYKKVISKT